MYFYILIKNSAVVITVSFQFCLENCVCVCVCHIIISDYIIHFYDVCILAMNTYSDQKNRLKKKTTTLHR